MSRIHAEIHNTGSNELRSCSITIDKPASEIFEVIASPAMHSQIDGSRTVKAVNWGPERLNLGAKFGMKMKIGIPYRITNLVTEFKENEVVAWQHLGRWTWRYELKALSPNQTLVRETFDARSTHLKWWLRRRNAYNIAEKSMAKTLVRLKAHLEDGPST